MGRVSLLPRRTRAAGVVVALFAVTVACSSSPTSPTPPTGTPPPPGPPPPAPSLTISCPASQNVSSTGNNPVPVTFAAPSTTGGLAPVQVTCTRTSGSLFPVGTTSVQCTATDAGATSRSCAFSISVAPPPPELTRATFLAFGDSTTLGEVTVPIGPDRLGSPGYRMVVVPSAAYPAQLLSLLRTRYTTQAGSIVITNAGNPTEWAEDGVRRLPGVMSSQRPQAVLLLEGINDLSALGTPGVMSAWRAIDTMAKEIRGRGARPFIATLPPSRPGGARSVPLALIQSLNNNIRSTVRGEGAVLVDLFEALSPDVSRYIGIDGVHPTEAGYRKIAETFYEAIRLDLERR